MASLVSGNPGSGKSTLAVELQRRGHRALDADLVPGLASWLDQDGAVVGDGSLKPTRELLTTCFWGWSAARLDEVLDGLGNGGILLGIAVNQWEFIERVDRLVLLELDQVTQGERLRLVIGCSGSRSRRGCLCSRRRCSCVARFVSMRLEPWRMLRRP